MHVVRLEGKGSMLLYGSTVHSSFIGCSECSKSELIIEFLVMSICTEHDKDIGELIMLISVLSVHLSYRLQMPAGLML